MLRSIFLTLLSLLCLSLELPAKEVAGRVGDATVPALAVQLYAQVRHPEWRTLPLEERYTRLLGLTRQLAAHRLVLNASPPVPGADERIDGLARRCEMKSLVMAISEFPSLEEVAAGITKQEIDAFRAENPNATEEIPGQFTFRHIFFLASPDPASPAWEEAQAKAQAAWQRLQAGADFAALARETDESPLPPAEKGEPLTRPMGALAPGSERAIRALDPGQFSAPYRSDHGYHLFLLEDVQEPVTTVSAQTDERIRKAIAERRKAEQNAAVRRRAEALFVERMFHVLDERDSPETDAAIRCGPYVFTVGDVARAREWDIGDYKTWKSTMLQLSRDQWLLEVICSDYQLAAYAHSLGWLSKPDIRKAIDAWRVFDLGAYLLYRTIQDRIGNPSDDELRAFRDAYAQFYVVDRRWEGEQIVIDPGISLEAPVAEYGLAVQLLWPWAEEIRQAMAAGEPVDAVLQRYREHVPQLWGGAVTLESLNDPENRYFKEHTENLKQGETTGIVALLNRKGLGIFRRTGREEMRLRPFEEIRHELAFYWRRERAEALIGEEAERILRGREVIVDQDAVRGIAMSFGQQ